MKLLLICLFGILLSGMPAVGKKHILYVGTYTKGVADGIFVYSFNNQNGRLTNLNKPAVSNNPSYLTISANRKYLYTVEELADLDSSKGGGVSAFRIEKDLKLTFINHVLTHGADPCHLTLSPDGKKMVVSNYTGGCLSMFNVLPDGSLSEMVQRIQDIGSGPFPGRQTVPHAHSARFDATGKHLFAADLGIDELKIYNVGVGETSFTPDSQPFVKFPPGSGPRHFDFSPDERFIYVINELSSTIAVLMKYGGDWKQVQTIKTIPKDYKGENWCADIHLSSDGRFVYGSNRGHNSLSVFKRDQTNGKLVLEQTISVEGNWPRNFTIDTTGRFILVANEKSNDITVFRIDESTGKIAFTGFKVSNQSPVCLQFLR
jgi:6-phosphogluconolactonase